MRIAGTFRERSWSQLGGTRSAPEDNGAEKGTSSLTSSKDPAETASNRYATGDGGAGVELALKARSAWRGLDSASIPPTVLCCRENPSEGTSCGGGRGGFARYLLKSPETEPRGSWQDSVGAILRSDLFGCGERGTAFAGVGAAKIDALGVVGADAIGVGGRRSIPKRQLRDAARELLLEVGKFRNPRCEQVRRLPFSGKPQLVWKRHQTQRNTNNVG